MKKLLLLLSMIVPAFLHAQETKSEPKFGISFTGFVKSDFFFDSREVYSIREGHFLLYPKEKMPDADGVDINDQKSFNFLSIQSRLTGKISGPDAFGAKTSGVLEADFFGNENAAFVDANGFRLRHAFVKLNWTRTELLAGQYWHAFFVPECFSGVISFNTGAPFQPFSRNPQLRITQAFGKFRLSAVVAAQRDFTSPQGSVSLQHAALPNVSALITFQAKNDVATHFAGIGLDYKTLKPLLTTSKGNAAFVTGEKVTGLSATAFFKRQSQHYTFKLQGVYGQNLFDHIMLGGYAVHSITDTTKNSVDYTTLNNLTAWTEFQTNGNKLQFGFWAGYSKNLGATKTILHYSNKVGGTDATVRGANVKSIFRVSPRLVFVQGKFNFATELELTSVAYATKNEQGQLNRDVYGVITDAEKVHNIRLLFSAIYHF